MEFYHWILCVALVAALFGYTETVFVYWVAEARFNVIYVVIVVAGLARNNNYKKLQNGI